MNYRAAVASALVVSLLAPLASCACTPEAPCQNTTNNYYEDDDSDETALIVVGGALLFGVILLAVAANRNDAPSPPPAQPPQPQTQTYVFAAPGATAEDMRLQRLFVQGHLSARTGNCEATRSIARHLAQSNPMFLERYRADPTIGSCLR